MKETKINIIQDAYQDPYQAMANAFLIGEYEFPISDLKCKKENLELFEEAIKEEFNIEKHSLELSGSNKSYFYIEESNEFMIVTSLGQRNAFTVHILGKHIEISTKVYNIFKKYEHYENESIINLVTFGLNSGRVTETSVQMNIEYFSANKKVYYPYIDVEEMFTQYSYSDENIMVLYGEPGTGKTRAVNLFLKFLMENPQICLDRKMNDNDYEDSDDEESVMLNVAYIKNEDVLSEDSFWERISNRNFAVVFLDDADYCLTSRKNQVSTQQDISKNKFLSQLLSYTDGIVRNNTKFIITTNIEMSDIDAAVLRKGRTFEILRLRKLKRQEAIEIWKSYELSESVFPFDSSFKEITASDLGSEISKYTNDKMSSRKKYIFEEGISILNKVGSKKVGF